MPDLFADSPADGLRRLSRLHSFLDLLPRFDLRHAQLEGLLEVLPQLGRGAEVAGKAQRRVGRYPALPFHRARACSLEMVVHRSLPGSVSKAFHEEELGSVSGIGLKWISAI